MNLSAPTMPIFLISLVLAILALIGQFASIAFVSPNAFWIAIIAYVVLMAGNLAKGL